MRAVLQRVARAEVRVEGKVVARIQRGLLVLLGVMRGDDEACAARFGERIAHWRCFPDATGRMNRSLLDTGGTLGVVSQFTLLGDARQGRRPSWVEAAAPEAAEPLVCAVVDAARARGVQVVSGRFRAEMEVALVNHGPVTVLLDSKRAF